MVQTSKPWTGLDVWTNAIEKGCCAAVRFEIQAIVRGEPRIVIEHVNRITKAAAPHWPRTKLEDDDCYRVIIRGSPNITQETAFRDARTGPREPALISRTEPRADTSRTCRAPAPAPPRSTARPSRGSARG